MLLIASGHVGGVGCTDWLGRAALAEEAEEARIADSGIRGTGSSGAFGMLMAWDSEFETSLSSFSCNENAATSEFALAADAACGVRQYRCRLLSICLGLTHRIFPQSSEPWRRMEDILRDVRADSQSLDDRYNLDSWEGRRNQCKRSAMSWHLRPLVSFPSSPPLFSQTALASGNGQRETRTRGAGKHVRSSRNMAAMIVSCMPHRSK